MPGKIYISCPVLSARVFLHGREERQPFPAREKTNACWDIKTSSRRKCLVRSTSSVPSGPTVPAAKFFGELQIQTDESDDEKKLSPASADGPAGVAADRSCPIRPKTFIPLKEQIRQASGA